MLVRPRARGCVFTRVTGDRPARNPIVALATIGLRFFVDFEQRLLERTHEGLGGTGREAEPLRSTRVEPGRTAGRDDQPAAETPHGLAEAKIDDRCLVDQVRL